MNQLFLASGVWALFLVAPTVSLAQQDPSSTDGPKMEGNPPPTYGQPAYPQPAYPQPAYPQQAYPQPTFPQQAYPQPPYPQPAQSAVPQPPAPDPGQDANPTPQETPLSGSAGDARWTFSASNDAAKQALSDCMDAMDHFRSDLVRQQCGLALEKDDKLRLAHALLSQVTPPRAKKKHIEAAKNATGQVTEGERLFAEGMLALAEDQRQVARAAFFALAALQPNEKRVYHYRGLIRLRLGDLDGAEADFRKTLELDAKFGPAHNALGFVLLRREKFEDAAKSFAKYVELAPKEANAHDSMAAFFLRKGDLGPAVESARKAVETDGKFLRGRLRFGDALLLQGNPIQARKEYQLVLSSPDPREHFDAAQHVAWSRLYEGVGIPTTKALQDAEKDLVAEADLAKKLLRRADQATALASVARLQLERGALVEAGKTVSAFRELLSAKDEEPPADASDKAATTFSVEERIRLTVELHWLRALLLQAVGEREWAGEQADAIEKVQRGKPGQRAAEDLRGELSARAGNRQVTVNHLTATERPQSRFALALALGGGKPGEQLDLPKARTLMEELSRRSVVDLEGALTRGRARLWLKQNPAQKNDAK